MGKCGCFKTFVVSALATGTVFGVLAIVAKKYVSNLDVDPTLLQQYAELPMTVQEIKAIAEDIQSRV